MTIFVRHVSKRFNLYARPMHRLKEWVTLGLREYHRPFWALRDVSFEAPSGVSLGIVGPNGAGKSTLLKIITGTLFPTEGEVEVEGRVAALLELGTGFHPEFTGRLNIRLNGKMLGLSDAEIDDRMGEIIAFSELGDFVDQPIRTYSSGMVMRLGFSIASCVSPDVLIVDEALSVGDAYFQQKCVRRIRQFREQGTTILFVSHDPTAVLTLCDRAILLEEGQVQREGAPREMLDFYNARTAQRSSASGVRIFIMDPANPSAVGSQRSGNFRVLIEHVELRDGDGHPTEVLTSGDAASLLVRLRFLEDVSEPVVGCLFRDAMGTEVFGVNTAGLGMHLGDFAAGQATDVVFDFPMDLGPADYSLTVAVHLDESHLVSNFDWIDGAWRFRVLTPSDAKFYGLARLRPRLRWSAGKPAEGNPSDAVAGVCPNPPPRLDGHASCDGFFLDGWAGDAGIATGDRTRRLEGKGRFLMKPASRTVAVEFEDVAPAGPDDSPRLSRFVERLEGRADGKRRWLFALPEAAVGCPAIFGLDAGGAGAVVRCIDSTCPEEAP